MVHRRAPLGVSYVERQVIYGRARPWVASFPAAHIALEQFSVERNASAGEPGISGIDRAES